MIRWMRVRGDSMLPRLAEGDLVLVTDWPWRLGGSPRAGDCVVFRHPIYGVLIKQVVELQPAAGTLTVRGTRPVSLDSQEFGPIPLADVLGKVVWVLRKS
jgi:signal peptidase I